MTDAADPGRAERDVIVNAIVAVAPDVADEIEDLDPDIDLFEEFGLDSMDRLNIMARLADATGMEIPERRLSSLVSLNDLRRELGI